MEPHQGAFLPGLGVMPDIPIPNNPFGASMMSSMNSLLQGQGPGAWWGSSSPVLPV
jgi:hypothetical protein